MVISHRRGNCRVLDIRDAVPSDPPLAPVRSKRGEVGAG
jgi:hypothetical protein